MTDFYTSDLHFGHDNVIQYCDRPFTTTEEMNEALITAWNATVGHKDKVFVVGDFSFLDGKRTHEILGRLRGNKTLVRGNHDLTECFSATNRWQWVRDRHVHRTDGDAIVLDHFPIMSWLGIHKGYYHLHGHCHGQLRYPAQYDNARILDVGVDATVKWTGSYRPVAWEEVKERLSGKGPVSVDGHEVREHGTGIKAGA